MRAATPDGPRGEARATAPEERFRGVPVAVLGATGFVGRWVARRLGRCGAELSLIVRSADRARPLFEALEVEGTVVEFDLSELHRLGGLLGRLRPAVTFNLAGYGVSPSERDPRLARLLNARLVERLCESLLAFGRPGNRDWDGVALVHAGSALEYGQAAGNLAEETEPRPTTPYGRSKLAGTTLLSELCRGAGLPGLTARLFTVYGPGEHEGRLLPSLLRTARTRQPLRLTAGHQRRDFTYVEDVAEGLVRLAASHAEPGAVVNLATGRLRSVRAFVEAAAELLEIPACLLRYGELPTRPEEMSHEAVSVERLRSLTGWTPPTGLREGIARTAAFETAHGRWPSD